MKHVHVTTVAAAAAAVSLLVPSLASARAEGPSAAEAATVRVTLTEFKIVLSARSARKGAVTFVVTNKGKLPHDFKIAGKKTPLLARGKSARLTVRFAKAGRFAYSCAVSGHGGAGMKGFFAVR